MISYASHIKYPSQSPQLWFPFLCVLSQLAEVMAQSVTRWCHTDELLTLRQSMCWHQPAPGIENRPWFKKQNIFPGPLCQFFVTHIIVYKISYSIQSSAIIRPSNIVKYCTNDCRNSGKISIRCWIHKRHPYLTLMGELWGVVCEYLLENGLCYNSTALHLYGNEFDLTWCDLNDGFCFHCFSFMQPC